MKKVLVFALVAVAVLFAWNAYVHSATNNRPGVDAIGHAALVVHPTEAVFDLREVSGSASKLDVLISLVEFNRNLGSNFKTIELQNHGEIRFTVHKPELDAFQRMWDETPNMRTALQFPQLVRTPDGRQPYPGYTGGWLGVMKGQAEDLNNLMDAWLR